MREAVRDRSRPQHSSPQRLPNPQVSDPTQLQWLGLHVGLLLLRWLLALVHVGTVQPRYENTLGQSRHAVSGPEMQCFGELFQLCLELNRSVLRSKMSDVLYDVAFICVTSSRLILGRWTRWSSFNCAERSRDVLFGISYREFGWAESSYVLIFLFLQSSRWTNRDDVREEVDSSDMVMFFLHCSDIFCSENYCTWMHYFDWLWINMMPEFDSQVLAIAKIWMWCPRLIKTMSFKIMSCSSSTTPTSYTRCSSRVLFDTFLYSVLRNLDESSWCCVSTNSARTWSDSLLRRSTETNWICQMRRNTHVAHERRCKSGNHVTVWDCKARWSCTCSEEPITTCSLWEGGGQNMKYDDHRRKNTT